YGPNETYPNLLIAVEDIGTDPALVGGSAQFASMYVAWFNESFYGEKARLDPQRGYVAPPLDGIWATAPYLHNGSVPTLAALLESGTRPKYWSRSADADDYDPIGVGLKFTPLAAGQSAEPDPQKRARIYDTEQMGYGNG